MKRTMIAVLAALSLPLAATAQAPAAQLENGKWSVSATNPGGGVVQLALDVSSVEGKQKGALTAPGMDMDFPLSDLKLEGAVLTFGFTIEGALVKCRLERNAQGGFGGPCADATGRAGRFDMTPPPSAAAGATGAAAAEGGMVKAGKWEGVANHPSLGTIPIALDVSATQPQKASLGLVGMGEAFPVDKLAMAGDKLSFRFTVEGQGQVSCEVKLSPEKTYTGTCIEDGGETSTVTLRAPAGN